jgi:nucleotide-binding universal stress UspA family protein
VKIVVATDLSPGARPAEETALRWAKKLGAELVLMHVVHDPVLAPALSNDVPGDKARAIDRLQKIADSVDGTCRIDVRSAEDLAAEIVEAAKGASFLFVGSQGRSAFERLRLGSVATAVLRRCHVPVVCCPHAQEAS